MTNAEYIKSLSTEDMAGEMCSWFDEGCDDCPGRELCEYGKGHANGLIKWLNEERREE